MKLSNTAEQPLVQVVDAAVSDAMFRETFFRLQEIGRAATYWKTFWFPWGEPANVAEALAIELRRHVPGQALGIGGVEWWIGRMHTSRVPLDLHHDRDLVLFEETGVVRHPEWSSVLFFNSVRGGSLFITDQRLVKRGGALRLSPANPRRFASTRPAPNRFALFPGNLFHGVLDAADRIPQRRLPGPAGELRWSIVFNWWRRAPRAVPLWSERRAYRALRIR